MSTEALWFYGCLGGLLPIVVRIAKSATAADVPNFYKWWLVPAAVASAFLGGLVVNMLDLQTAVELTGFSQKFTVLLVGYAAPNILANLAGVAGEKIAPVPVPAPAPEPSLAPTPTPAPEGTFARFLRA